MDRTIRKTIRILPMNWMILCLTVGLCWAGAPIIGRISQLSPWMMAGFVAVGTFIPIIPLLFWENYHNLTTRQILLGLLAGVLNGIGLLAWYRLVTGSAQGFWNIGTVLPVAMILVCVILVFGGRIFFSEILTVQRILGLVLACGAIYCLR
jgi:drug/metabolite transporter (DMT)-like permease